MGISFLYLVSSSLFLSSCTFFLSFFRFHLRYFFFLSLLDLLSLLLHSFALLYLFFLFPCKFDNLFIYFLLFLLHFSILTSVSFYFLEQLLVICVSFIQIFLSTFISHFYLIFSKHISRVSFSHRFIYLFTTFKQCPFYLFIDAEVCFAFLLLVLFTIFSISDPTSISIIIFNFPTFISFPFIFYVTFKWAFLLYTVFLLLSS